MACRGDKTRSECTLQDQQDKQDSQDRVAANDDRRGGVAVVLRWGVARAKLS